MVPEEETLLQNSNGGHRTGKLNHTTVMKVTRVWNKRGVRGGGGEGGVAS